MAMAICIAKNSWNWLTFFFFFCFSVFFFCLFFFGSMAMVEECLSSGACFSKVLRAFRARKASCQAAIRLFWKADLLTCFWCKKNQEDCEVWRLRTSALRRYKGNCGTRNRPEKFRDFWGLQMKKIWRSCFRDWRHTKKSLCSHL